MEVFQHYELRKDAQSDEYTLIVYADNYLSVRVW